MVINKDDAFADVEHSLKYNFDVAYGNMNKLWFEVGPVSDQFVYNTNLDLYVADPRRILDILQSDSTDVHKGNYWWKMWKLAAFAIVWNQVSGINQLVVVHD